MTLRPSLLWAVPSGQLKDGGSYSISSSEGDFWVDNRIGLPPALRGLLYRGKMPKRDSQKDGSIPVNHTDPTLARRVLREAYRFTCMSIDARRRYLRAGPHAL